jgi:hypothetical protein
MPVSHLTSRFRCPDFATHVLDFAELAALKGYNIILVYHPSNAWHGAANRILKDTAHAKWDLI